jgi:hypothetical protein
MRLLVVAANWLAAHFRAAMAQRLSSIATAVVGGVQGGGRLDCLDVLIEKVRAPPREQLRFAAANRAWLTKLLSVSWACEQNIARRFR